MNSLKIKGSRLNPNFFSTVSQTDGEVNKNVDSEGRILSAQQRKYFSDSKVRDDNGNLMVMFLY